jgi:hypothetical protein
MGRSSSRERRKAASFSAARSGQLWNSLLLTFRLSCRVEREDGFGEATLDEVGASLDAAQAAADGLDKVVAVAEDDVGGSAAPEQRPDALTGLRSGA